MNDVFSEELEISKAEAEELLSAFPQSETEVETEEFDEALEFGAEELVVDEDLEFTDEFAEVAFPLDMELEDLEAGFEFPAELEMEPDLVPDSEFPEPLLDEELGIEPALTEWDTELLPGEPQLGLEVEAADVELPSMAEGFGLSKTCMDYRRKSAEYYRRYLATKRRIYLCYAYRFRAAYYHCLYRAGYGRRYLCSYYYYWAKYQCCQYRVNKSKLNLCHCYRYVALYYCCLWRMTRRTVYLEYCRRYFAAYQNCM